MVYFSGFEEKKQKKRDRDKAYAKEWRKRNQDKIKAYLKRSKVQRRKVRVVYYAKHKLEHNKYCSDRRKRTGYAEDKTPERRRDMLIRSKTRAKYPFGDNNCVQCDNKATQRHHTTDPMEVDKFDFMCRKHHDELHVKLNDAKQEVLE